MGGSDSCAMGRDYRSFFRIAQAEKLRLLKLPPSRPFYLIDFQIFGRSIASFQGREDAAWPAIPDLETCPRLPPKNGDSTRWPLLSRAVNHRMLPRENRSRVSQQGTLIA